MTVDDRDRVKVLSISHNLMLGIILGRVFLSDLNLPAGSEVVSVQHEFARRGFGLLIQNPEFPVVELGSEAPRMEILRIDVPDGPIYRVTEEQVDDIGDIAETCDHLLGALELSVSDELHVAGIRSSLPDITKKLKAWVTAVTGENPWEGL